jgi:uncharacterized protein YjbI with pentapeptide repeats
MKIHKQKREKLVMKKVWYQNSICIGAALLVSACAKPLSQQPEWCGAQPAPGISWDSCDKRSSVIKQADLTGTTVNNAMLSFTVVEQSVLRNISGSEVLWRYAVIEHSDLSGAQLPGVDFSMSVGNSVSFANAGLSEAIFRKSVYENADFSEADLSGADFSSAVLKGSNFHNAKIAGAKFEGAILTGARWVDGHICEEGSVGLCR